MNGYATAPWQNITCAGLMSLAVLLVQLRHGPDDPADPAWWFVSRIANVQLPALLFLAGGITLTIRYGYGLYFMLAGTLTAFPGAVYNAWVCSSRSSASTPIPRAMHSGAWRHHIEDRQATVGSTLERIDQSLRVDEAQACLDPDTDTDTARGVYELPTCQQVINFGFARLVQEGTSTSPARRSLPAGLFSIRGPGGAMTRRVSSLPVSDPKKNVRCDRAGTGVPALPACAPALRAVVSV